MTNRRNKVFSLFKGATLTAVLATTLSFSTVTQANDVQRLVNSLCEAAKADDRTGMRKKLKSAKIRLKKIYSGVQCGDQGSLLRAATNAGALNAATFIATKIGKDNLAMAESDGKNIVQFAQGLVAAGDASKQAFVDLYNSKM
ncbi:DUF3718 domain-containing protein [Aliikangiella marina]|uniref:DUF3718 domain-containing protein n=1 Tax=Aliikangiella marina TaxID=1712262 RepID=A0A545TH17_9GAMM|nr:DUF3718 domain-containing protein [Aliikangiella marina]TQV76523.1 DUF3718 domain-containing protein [Aliikangiella marina]